MPKGKNTLLKKIYFSPEEWAVVERRAAKAGKKGTAFVKDIAMFGEIKLYDFSEYQKTIFPIRGIAVNINQIATVANSTGMVSRKDIEDIRENYRVLKALFDEHFKELKYTLIV